MRAGDRRYARFAAPDLVLDGPTEFMLHLSEGISRQDLGLVIDVYDLDNPVHPAGHVGWWKFPVAQMGGVAKGIIANTGNGIEVSLESASATERWVNAAPPAWRRLVVNAALRSNGSNEVVSLDRVPALRSGEDLVALRSTLDRDWTKPRFAASSYVFPAGTTVRIIARNIFPRDAVGNFCLDIFRTLTQQGVPTAMYAEVFDLALNDVVRRLDTLDVEGQPPDVLLYFFSTFDPYLDGILRLDCRRKIAYFHGITRPELLREFDPELAEVCEEALAQIGRLSEFDVLAANSRENARRMTSHFGEPSKWRLKDIQIVAPKLLPLGERPAQITSRRPETTKLLYVGRIKSHKKIEHVLELFSEYLRLDAQAECLIVGSGADEAYREYLASVERSQLKIPQARVRWLGSVDDEALSGLYGSASVFVCMSEDEGFCLPVLEAMLAGIPVFVYGLPAVREMMDDAGCFFDEKDFKHLAKVLYRLINDERMRAEIVRRQCERAVALAREMDGRSVLKLLSPPVAN